MENHNKESKAEKVHKLLDKALEVKTAGEYSGVWRFDYSGSKFQRERKEPSAKPNHSDKIINESFPLGDITSVEQLSETKNMSGIAKASVLGAVVAGPVGALAAGAFAASKNSIFVEVTLQNNAKFHCHMSQDAFENTLMDIRSRERQPEFKGISSNISGEEDLSSATTGCLVVIAIFIVLGVIGNLIDK
jgi:hypothetical protein